MTENRVFVVSAPRAYVGTDTDSEPYYGTSPVTNPTPVSADTDSEPMIGPGGTPLKVYVDSDGEPFVAEPEIAREEPIGISNTPFYVKRTQDWAIDQEIYRHDQALWTTGELCMFALMWRVEDFNHGLVQRCQTCYKGALAREAAVFNQPTKTRCPDCFGTTFEGGYRALIIRPTLIGDTDDQENVGEHGTTNPQTVSIEATSDFRFRNGDYFFRKDNSRWQLTAPQRVTVRTGFDHPTQANNSIGYQQGMAALENPNTSVAYDIPPAATDLVTKLSAPSRYPAVQQDILRGPLIPPAWTD